MSHVVSYQAVSSGAANSWLSADYWRARFNIMNSGFDSWLHGYQRLNVMLMVASGARGFFFVRLLATEAPTVYQEFYHTF